MPRSWVATSGDLVFYKVHEKVCIILPLLCIAANMKESANVSFSGWPFCSSGATGGTLGRCGGVRCAGVALAILRLGSLVASHVLS